VAAVEVFFEKSKKCARGCGSRGTEEGGEKIVVGSGRHCPLDDFSRVNPCNIKITHFEERPLVRYLYSPPSKYRDCGDTTEL
jgi:hypothetical protein